MKRNLSYFLIIIFAFCYFFPRLFNLNKNLEFRYDQGLHLLETKDMIDNSRLRLLGPAVTSKTFIGRQFFIGATYYYFLSTIGLISHWSPLLIIQIIIIFEFIFYALFLNYLRHHFGFLPSVITAIVICFSPYLIFHSFFFWNPHFLIPLSIMFLLLKKHPYLSAFIWGLAFSFHYTAAFWIIPFIIFRFKYHQFNFKTILSAMAFFSLANIPFILSEFRHQFYNLKTIFLIFTNSATSFEVTPHYFIFPLLIFLIYGLVLISKKNHHPYYLFLLLFLIYKDKSSLDNIVGWHFPEQIKVSQLISENCTSNFNIATTIGGDTRSYDLRYLLNINNCLPNSVDDYPQSSTIFLIAPPTRPPETESVWEIDSFKPFTITSQQKINDHVIFYRLDK